ncbi:hypothetical protein GOP47_0028272 [Adiantum capillus-veneris]|nr:hypothetical protein GOP47_0028272 [Adiantum capillus-veneris]
MSAIKVVDDADPNEDCIALRTALEDILCDKKALMGVICHRNQQQRMRIRHMYGLKYEEDLIKRLRAKLHRNLETVVALWMCDPAERDAVIIGNALKGWIKDLAAVVEIIYVRTPVEVAEISRAYRATFNRSLEEDIGLRTSGDDKKFLLALVREDRPDVFEPDMAVAVSDANDLAMAISGRNIAAKSRIIKIVTTRSPMQMKATLDYYKQTFRHSLQKIIKQEIKGSFQELLRVALKCAKNPVSYFAKALYTSMKGLGTDDPTLIRIVVMRAEVDMEEIKAYFHKKYEKSLQAMIISDTSGSYRTFLLFLTGATLSEIQAVSSLSHVFSSRRR